MKFSRSFFVALVSVSLFVSCSNDDDEAVVDSSDYNQGVLVLNEGSAGQGSVSYISNDLSVFTKDAYTTANSSDLLGKYVQSIFFDGDKAYIIAGGSNKITVVNRNTFKIIAKIESGLVAPRYGIVKDGKAYVTNANTYADWGASATAPGNTDDYVAVIDLATNKFESKIDLNATANRIVEKNGKLYITESYTSSQLLVVNIGTKALETPITIGSSADTMEEKDGILYVLRSPYVDRSEIVKVNLSDKTMSKITFPESLDGAGYLDIYNNKIYYSVSNSVYSINTTATVASTTPILTATSIANLYGFAVNNNRIYLSDSGDFKSDSKAYVYNLTGTLEKEFTVGVGPNGFYFND